MNNNNMDQIRQCMIKAAQELRTLARTTDKPSLKHRLLDQADQLERASQEDSQVETDFAPRRLAMELPQSTHS